MTTAPNYVYDVFISYSPTDQDWVCDELLPRLEQADLKVIIDHRDFALGVARLVNVEEAVRNSRKILLVLSPNATSNKWAHFEALLAQTADPDGHQPRVLPLLLEPCDLPERLAMLTPADFTNPANRDKQMVRLLRTLGAKHRVFISYRHGAEPDEALAKQLAAQIAKAGHNVFIDQMMQIGVEWATDIQRQIEASDFVIVLLSAAAAQSEMAAKEVEFAYRQFQRAGRPKLLPVRVNYADSLPYQFSLYLDMLRFAEWRGKTDTRRLSLQLLDAIGHGEHLPSPQQVAATAAPAKLAPPAAHADPRFIESLDEPGGAVRLRSDVYVERDADKALRFELNKSRGVTTTIQAPRQTGKSSLLIRGVAQSQERGNKVVFLDLQPVDDLFLQGLDGFLRYFAGIILTKLGLDIDRLEHAWRSPLGPPDKITSLMEGYVLAQSSAKVVLAMDEADRILNTTFHDSFFGLLRSWHNKRAMSEVWDKLDIFMVISTEPNLLIRDMHQSPFNVGKKIILEDFNAQQIEELNTRYQAILQERYLPALLELLNGHPYLTSRALYTLLTEDIAWQQFTRVAGAEKGPFGDHLRRYLWMLRDQPQQRDALKQVILHQRCPNDLLYYQLTQAGLIKGTDARSCTCRCKLYEIYLKDKL
jgi:AAA-like domain/TIR domain